MKKQISTTDRWINILIWISILFSSSDIFLVFSAGGLTVRISQLISLAVMVCFLFRLKKDPVFPVPVAIVQIVIVAIFNTVFILNSRTLFNAIGYDLWLIFDIIQILVFTAYLSRTESVSSVVRKYIYCFDGLALVGLLQFVLQYFGINLLVTQVNEMHRSNGLSFEPSFYATYMLMGTVICLYLYEKGNTECMSKERLTVSLLLNVLALVLSTSRMGWIMLVAYVVYRALLFVIRNCRRNLTIVEFLMYFVPMALIVLLVFLVWAVKNQVPFVMRYMSGLGIGGASAHSSTIRIGSMLDTWNLFLKHPFLGCSLGGLDAAILAGKGMGYTVANNGDASNCVSIEALAAYGIFGAYFFFKYMYLLTFGQYFKLKAIVRKEENKNGIELIYAMILALVFEFLILQFNQNILRPVFWVHIALLSTVICIFENSKLDVSTLYN